MGWVAASNLQPGMEIASINGKKTIVNSVCSHKADETVFNFEVKGLHSYFVGNGVWVHNTSAYNDDPEVEALFAFMRGEEEVTADSGSAVQTTGGFGGNSSVENSAIPEVISANGDMTVQSWKKLVQNEGGEATTSSDLSSIPNPYIASPPSESIELRRHDSLFGATPVREQDGVFHEDSIPGWTTNNPEKPFDIFRDIDPTAPYKQERYEMAPDYLAELHLSGKIDNVQLHKATGKLIKNPEIIKEGGGFRIDIGKYGVVEVPHFEVISGVVVFKKGSNKLPVGFGSRRQRKTGNLGVRTALVSRGRLPGMGYIQSIKTIMKRGKDMGFDFSTESIKKYLYARMLRDRGIPSYIVRETTIGIRKVVWQVAAAADSASLVKAGQKTSYNASRALRELDAILSNKPKREQQ